jgi:hypothetical protein
MPSCAGRELQLAALSASQRNLVIRLLRREKALTGAAVERSTRWQTRYGLYGTGPEQDQHRKKPLEIGRTRQGAASSVLAIGARFGARLLVSNAPHQSRPVTGAG